MRYTPWLLIAALILSAGSKAQELELSKSSLEFTAGAGIPIGVFASKKNSIESGLAMNGLSINIEYNRYFKPKVGYFIGLRRSVFPLDVDAWTNSNPNATSDPWRIHLLYGGLARSQRIREKTILIGKAGIGLATSEYPEATIIWNPSPNLIATKFTSNKGEDPAFILGTTFKHLFSQQIHFALTLDYLTTSPRFIVTRTVTNGQSSSSTNLHYTQNMQAITVGLSVCYNFFPKK